MVERHKGWTVSVLISQAILGSLLLLGCEKGSEHADSFQISKAYLKPEFVKEGEHVSLVFEAISGGGDITLEIEWLRNGLPIEEVTEPELSSFYFERGDSIGADLRVKRGQEVVGVFELGPVVCINSPPALSDVNIYTVDSTTLLARVDYEDADEDEVTIDQKWYRNGVFVHEGEALTTTLRRGDTVVVEATPYDDVASGRTVRSAPVIVGNQAPRISSDPPGITGDRYVYHIDAADADGDDLSYRVTEGPAGMRVDPAGVLSWLRAGGADSIYTIVVEVADGHGGSAVQTFELKITER